MKMTFRWFGPGEDSVSLSEIRQIPGIDGIVGALYDVPAGEEWPMEEILALKKQANDAGLSLEVIESVNVHEDIKLGLPTRDQYIENYIRTVRSLAKAGVKVICYNFMPVFDWVRTDLALPLPDGSRAMAYDDGALSGLSPKELVEKIAGGSGGFSLPGWEPDRLKALEDLFERYRDVDEEKLFGNLGYFLHAVIPVCEETGVKMAIHPDDPPWSLFGLPRIATCQKNLDRIIGLADSPCNGITLCSGSLGANRENDIPALIRHFGAMGKISFAHVRNIRFTGERSYRECAHLSRDGSLDMLEIMRAYRDVGFDGYMRPDHGRSVWGEQSRPGYGLYDRALGAAYLAGLWEAVSS